MARRNLQTGGEQPPRGPQSVYSVVLTMTQRPKQEGNHHVHNVART
jgi:hypothetical protein